MDAIVAYGDEEAIASTRMAAQEVHGLGRSGDVTDDEVVGQGLPRAGGWRDRGLGDPAGREPDLAAAACGVRREVVAKAGVV